MIIFVEESKTNVGGDLILHRWEKDGSLARAYFDKNYAYDPNWRWHFDISEVSSESLNSKRVQLGQTRPTFCIDECKEADLLKWL